MATLNFPSSPTLNQQYTANGSTWTWDGVSWLAFNGPASGYSGISGYSGVSGYSGSPGSSGLGISGYSGLSGYSGISGISGYSGKSGYSGSGISGYSGSGISGYSGKSGYSGLTPTSTPINSQTSAYVLVAGDAGSTISITNGGVTIPASVLSAGNLVTIYNNSASSQTITQGSGLTLQWGGQASPTTGNRTLVFYGICTVLFITSTNAVIIGSGLT
jgi:hypothetical protein